MGLVMLERRERAAAGPQLPPVLRRDIRFGAAVYGTFLAASVVGVAYESGAGARTMTLSLLGSMLVFWAAHVWSEVVGERIRRGDALGPRHVLLTACREWPLSKPLPCRPSCSRSRGPERGLARRARRSRSLQRSCRPPGGESLRAGAAEGAGSQPRYWARGNGVLAVLLLVAERGLH